MLLLLESGRVRVGVRVRVTVRVRVRARARVRIRVRARVRVRVRMRVRRLLLLERLAHARGHGGALLLALVEHAPREPLVAHVDLVRVRVS